MDLGKMLQMQGRPLGRTCAICGKPGGTPMTLKLRWMGVAGDYAHPQCVAAKK